MAETAVWLAVAAGSTALVWLRRCGVGAPVLSADDRLDALIKEHWQWRMAANPELASFFGDRKPDLDDRSPAAYTRLHGHVSGVLAKLATISVDDLSTDAAKLKKTLFEGSLRDVREGLQYKSYLMAMSSLEGPQVDFPHVIGWLAAGTPDYECLLSVLQQFPRQVGQVIELMRLGMKEGRVLPPCSLRGVANQLMTHVETAAEDSPFYKPFADGLARSSGVAESKGSDGEGTEAAALSPKVAAQALAAVKDGVIPAYKQLLYFFQSEYLPAAKARESTSCLDLPNGAAMYEACLRFHTSTDLTAEEIHSWGLREVDRIRGEMNKVRAEAGFEGSLQEFAAHLKSDAKFFMDDEDELIRGYQAIVDHVEPLLPSMFGTLPSTSCLVKKMSPAQGNNAPAAYYYAGTEDGSRPGIFWANTQSLRSRKTYEMATLTMHEAIPGHHLQVTLAMENPDLACFQRHLEDRRYNEAPGRFPLYSAYVEGWGLYSEALGHEIEGVYTNPYSKFGQLSYEMFRACRLVVDTGLHHYRWSVDRAVDYVCENAMMEAAAVKPEIDRYVTWPGQACGYKIGQLKISEVRARAESVLGDSFSLRDFHDLVLGMGPVPLSVLEEAIDRWVAETRTLK